MKKLVVMLIMTILFCGCQKTGTGIEIETGQKGVQIGQVWEALPFGAQVEVLEVSDRFVIYTYLLDREENLFARRKESFCKYYKYAHLKWD